MKSSLLLKRATLEHVAPTFRTRPTSLFQASVSNKEQSIAFGSEGLRNFSMTMRLFKDETKADFVNQAKELNKKGQELQDEASTKHGGQIDYAIREAKEKQARTPWHREGSDQAPVRRMRSAGAMTKGKLLTTPSRLLKLILPLTIVDKSSDRKDIEPLALLVHPQQPLSYLERLIQSELPMIKSKAGEDKIPSVCFRAEDSASEESQEEPDDLETSDSEEGSDEHIIDGKLIKTGKISKDDLEKEVQNINVARTLRGGPGEGGVETYSGLGHQSARQKPKRFVRWSSSTEIGDFIRDAARGKEFAVEIEGARKEIRVGVPSFNDRTHYLRVRLRKIAKQLDSLAALKKECDDLAHRSAQRLAMGGFGILMTWWAAIYYFTFRTEYGWETMEPITYLAGLSTIMIGYLYFLWHNREVSYRAALHMTVSRRQSQLYAARGFDVQRWESLIEEANALRKEIKTIANEYDVEWNEKADEGSERVHKALREERKKKERMIEEEEDEDGDGDGDKDTKGKEKAKKDN